MTYQPEVGDIRVLSLTGDSYRCMKTRSLISHEGKIYSTHAWWCKIDFLTERPMGFWKIYSNDTWIEPKSKIEIET